MPHFPPGFHSMVPPCCFRQPDDRKTYACPAGIAGLLATRDLKTWSGARVYAFERGSAESRVLTGTGGHFGCGWSANTGPSGAAPVDDHPARPGVRPSSRVDRVAPLSHTTCSSSLNPA